MALDPVLIERTTLTNKRILEAEAAEALDDLDGTNPGMRTYGCLIAWNSTDQLSALGILHVILTLILVSGKSSLAVRPRLFAFSDSLRFHITPLLFLRDRFYVVV